MGLAGRFKLAPQLTWKAQQAYAALPLDSVKVYETLKAAILRCYNTSEKTYRKHFRSLEMKTGGTPQERKSKTSGETGVS